MTFGPNGSVVQLMPLHPDRMRPERTKDGGFRYRFKNDDGTEVVFQRDEIFRIMGMSDDGLNPLNPIELARETIGLGLSAQEYGARYFQNNAAPSGGWIEHPGQFKDKTARDNFRESIQNAQTGGNRHKLLVLEGAMKFHELGVKNNDAQFLETRQFSVTDIARIFRVPPHLIGDLSKSTNNNIEQKSLEFVKFTMAPHAERWEWAIETDLLLEDDGLEVEYDFAGLLRGDAAARGAFYGSGINAGWLTRNEARQREDLNPIDGLDEPLRPLNMVEETEAQELHDKAMTKPDAPPPPTPGKLPAPESEPKPPPPPKSDVERQIVAAITSSNDGLMGQLIAARASRLVALSTAAAERIARREFESASAAIDCGRDLADVYRKHEKVVSAALGVTEEAARAYCGRRLKQIATPMSPADWEALARTELESLALKGTV